MLYRKESRKIQQFLSIHYETLKECFFLYHYFQYFPEQAKIHFKQRKTSQTILGMCSWKSLQVLRDTAAGSLRYVWGVQCRKEVENHLGNISLFQTTYYKVLPRSQCIVVSLIISITPCTCKFDDIQVGVSSQPLKKKFVRPKKFSEIHNYLCQVSQEFLPVRTLKSNLT